MRYTRLRRQIEGGTLIGTHGTPFAEKAPFHIRKRTRVTQPEVGEREQPAVFAKTSSPDRQIKSEPGDFSDPYESVSSDGDDSEDEMPLAKRRQDRIKLGYASSDDPPVAISHHAFSLELHEWQDSHSLAPNAQQGISQSRPEVFEDRRGTVNNSIPNARLYTPESRIDVTAQALEGNEDHCQTRTTKTGPPASNIPKTMAH
jgi:hypothetical protein